VGSKMFDFYRRISVSDERMAVRRGSGLPSHVDAADWVLMTNLTESSPEQWVDDLKEDIDARGFSYFKLVK
jgi:hypothetical protein